MMRDQCVPEWTKVSETGPHHHMSHLNDRLAQYIHRVKELDLNNNSIQQLVTPLEQTNNK